MTPQALRRRMAHGNIYRPSKVDASLSSYFRDGNLTALRELALLWLADRVDDASTLPRPHEHPGDLGRQGAHRRRRHRWRRGETLMRRGARLATGGRGRVARGLRHRHRRPARHAPGPARRPSSQAEELGGTFHSVVGEDAGRRDRRLRGRQNATKVVVGASVAAASRRCSVPGTASGSIAASGDIDVHLVTHDDAAGRPERRRPSDNARPAPPDRRLGRRRWCSPAAAEPGPAPSRTSTACRSGDALWPSWSRPPSSAGCCRRCSSRRSRASGPQLPLHAAARHPHRRGAGEPRRPSRSSSRSPRGWRRSWTAPPAGRSRPPARTEADTLTVLAPVLTGQDTAGLRSSACRDFAPGRRSLGATATGGGRSSRRPAPRHLRRGRDTRVAVDDEHAGRLRASRCRPATSGCSRRSPPTRSMAERRRAQRERERAAALEGADRRDGAAARRLARPPHPAGDVGPPSTGWR